MYAKFSKCIEGYEMINGKEIYEMNFMDHASM